MLSWPRLAVSLPYEINFSIFTVDEPSPSDVTDVLEVDSTPLGV